MKNQQEIKNPLQRFITGRNLANPHQWTDCFAEIAKAKIASDKLVYASRGIDYEAQFDVDEYNKGVVDFFSAYIANSDTLRDKGFSPQKGVFIMGDIGTGKNTIMASYNWFCSAFSGWYRDTCRPVNGGRKGSFPARLFPHRSVSSRMFSEEFKALGLSGIMKKYGESNLLINDIGTRDNVAASFGNRYHPISDFIEEVYDYRGKFGYLYLTANLNEEGLEEMYGKRTVDRIKEMCNIVVLSGPSRRK